MQNILLKFKLTGDKKLCGLFFENILHSALLDNIGFKDVDEMYNCEYITLSNSNLELKNIKIENKIFKD